MADLAMSDAAIQQLKCVLDCHASLAMTIMNVLQRTTEQLQINNME